MTPLQRKLKEERERLVVLQQNYMAGNPYNTDSNGNLRSQNNNIEHRQPEQLGKSSANQFITAAHTPFDMIAYEGAVTKCDVSPDDDSDEPNIEQDDLGPKEKITSASLIVDLERLVAHKEAMHATYFAKELTDTNWRSPAFHDRKMQKREKGLGMRLTRTFQRLERFRYGRINQIASRFHVIGPPKQ